MVFGPPAQAQITPAPGATALQTVPGQNEAQADMARGIDAVCPTLVTNLTALNPRQTRLAEICRRMVQTANDVTASGGPTAFSYGLDQEELNGALQAINAEELQVPQTELVEVRSAQLLNISARLDALRAIETTPALAVTGFAPSPAQAPVLVASSDGPVPIGFPALNLDEGDATAVSSGPLGGRLGVFLTGTLSAGERDSTDALGGFDFDNQGLTAGVDWRLSDTTILGAALGFSLFDTDFETTIDSPPGQSLESDSYTLSLYGSFYPAQGLYLDAVASLGLSAYDSQRRVLIASDSGEPSEDQRLDADFNALTYGVSLTAGYDFAFQALAVSPTVGVSFLRTDIEGYTEDGTDPATGGESPLAFEVDDYAANSLTLPVGVQASYPISLDFGVLNPTLRARWVFELAGDDDGPEVSYAADPTGLSAFTITTTDKDSNYGVLEAGASLTLPNDFSLFAEYGTVVALDDFTQHSVSVGLRKAF